VTASVEIRVAREQTVAPWPGKLDFPHPHVPTRHRTTFLPFSPPAIGEEEIAAVVDTLRSEWITTGPKTHQFAAEFAEFIGAIDALPLNSCTAGLHTALVTSGVGPGDEVVTTPMTFAASVNVIEHVGATPIMVDVEPDTLNIDPVLVEKAVSSRTRAIIAVHYAGHPAELERLRKIAWKYNLVLIEDAAHALPAKYKGVHIGAGPNPVAFSFYATKNMTTGEGGMLTGDSEFIEKARVVSLHGMSRDAWRRYAKGGSWRYDILTPGFKYNMTDIAAALGLCQLRKLNGFQRRRREIVNAYTGAFSECDALEVPVERAEVEHAWHLYVLRLKSERLVITRDQFIDELTRRNIATSVHFIPIHLHPYYRDKYQLLPDRFPVAVDNFARMLSLPLNPRMTDDDVLDVIDAVLDVVRVNQR
jgi:dTDP-4-amino-4,6-dideoxygalactose transaminase